MFIHLLLCVVKNVCVVVALSRVSRDWQRRRRGRKKARRRRSGAFIEQRCVCVCVYSISRTDDGRGHHRRRPTHKTFPILYCTNDKRKLSSRLSFAFCVSRPTTEAKHHHHHHHHGWRRRAREAHEGTTTTTRPPFFFRRPVVGGADRLPLFFFKVSPKRKGGETQIVFFFSTIIRDYHRFQKEEGE